MPSAADRPRDPGLAAERTALAWQRMATGFITLAALTLGAAARSGVPWLAVPAPALLAVAVAVYLHGRRRAAGGPPDRRALGGLTASVLAAAAAAAVLVIARGGS
jgi:hypothetical protein